MTSTNKSTGGRLGTKLRQLARSDGGPSAAAVAGLYLIVGLCWVLLADSAIGTLVHQGLAPGWLMPAKGLLLIGSSAALFYGMLSSSQARRDRDQVELKHLRGELEFVSRSAGAARWQLLTATGEASRSLLRARIYPSRAACMMLGISHSGGPQAAARWLRRIAPRDLRHLISQGQACLSGTRKNFDLDLRVKRNDREWRWLRCRGRLHSPDAGNGMIWSGVVTDVTDEHEAVVQLRSLGMLFESSRDGIAVISHDGAIRSHNKAFSRITGLMADAGDHAHLERLGLQPLQEASFEDVVRKASARGSWLGKLTMRRGKREIELGGRMTPVTDESDRLSHLVLILFEAGSSEDSVNKVKTLAAADPLTGLPPLSRFIDHATQCIQRMEDPASASFASIRISRLREINAYHGPSAGDQLLRDIARRLQSSGAELIARASGGRFCALQATSWNDSQRINWGRILRRSLEAPVMIDGHRIYPCARIGLATFDAEGGVTQSLRYAEGAADFTELSRGAEPAIFGQVVRSQLAKAHRQEQALRRALDQRELACHFQPVMDLSNQKLVGCEALLRWHHNGKWVSPYEFVPVAERCGLMPEIGQWILWASVRRVAQWRKDGRIPPHFRLAVNASVTQFGPHWAAQILATLKRAQLPAAQFTVEFGDAGQAEQLAELRAQFQQLRKAGVRISLDDFGVGPASVALLQQLPLDSIKIGRNFLRQVPDHDNANALVSAILQMARIHGTDVICVGVESAEQRRFLLEHGCLYGQGYLFSEPMDAGAFEQRYLSGPTVGNAEDDLQQQLQGS